MPLNLCCLALVLLLMPCRAWVQVRTDSTLLLPEVTVSALPLRISPSGEQVERHDAERLAGLSQLDLAGLLRREGGVYIRQYGPGTLATASMRGGSAAHTSVLWNGLPLQSPMLGVQDLSLLPLFLMDEVRIHHGSSGATWGSGAVGGALMLENKLQAPQGLSARLSGMLGQYGQEEQQVTLRFRRADVGVVTRAFRASARNDYHFRLQAGAPRQRQVHAANRREGLLQELYWQPGPRHQLGLQLWWQANHREIPPTTVQNLSLARQDDRALRSALQWRMSGPRHTLQVRGAWFGEQIDFRDPPSGVAALTRFRTLLLEAEAHRQFLPGLSLQTGVNHHYTRAEAEAYQGRPRLDRSAVFGLLRAEGKALEAQLQVRQEWAQGRPMPFQPAAGLSARPWRPLTLRARVARHLRLPTANDLFWMPGGNPDLRPEQGWSQEAGWDLDLPFGLRWKSTVYHRLIKDWILWSLAKGQVFWSANNITRVRSRGLEQRLDWEYSGAGGPVIRLSLGYDLTRSTNEVALTRPLLHAGSQLHYVPVHQGFAVCTVQWRGWQGQYQHRYTSGVRGIQTDLPAFDLGWAAVEKTLTLGSHSARVFLQLENTWDNTYRVVERRPMPGRWYSGGITLNLNPSL
jgi:vitamin B12 transporter